MLQEIKANLEEELKLLKQLVDLALQKREYIIEKKSEELAKNLAASDLTVKKVYQLVEEREKLYQKMDFKGNLYQLIADKVAQAEKEGWLSLLEERKKTAEKLQREESLNKKLIEDQLELVKFMLNLIQPPEKKEVKTYNRKGRVQTMGNVIGVNFRG